MPKIGENWYLTFLMAKQNTVGKFEKHEYEKFGWSMVKQSTLLSIVDLRWFDNLLQGQACGQMRNSFFGACFCRCTNNLICSSFSNGVCTNKPPPAPRVTRLKPVNTPKPQPPTTTRPPTQPESTTTSVNCYELFKVFESTSNPAFEKLFRANCEHLFGWFMNG